MGLKVQKTYARYSFRSVKAFELIRVEKPGKILGSVKKLSKKLYELKISKFVSLNFF